MQTLTINIQNETLTEKVLWMLEHFKSDGLEITSREDIVDLKLLKSTRNEETVSFDNYLKNGN
ncbi:MAG: hypothetical protein HOM84_05970 [Thiotrichales bacterium]|jgi:outer membrane lipopolysaccharide assembly protein LptE/RlpB|nr:hypothetical protein [Thiotrichales bacterium]MBT5292070.1 hypothetical protein [Thiotrichales bacterium]